MIYLKGGIKNFKIGIEMLSDKDEPNGHIIR
jgi:hypothetical protein